MAVTLNAGVYGDALCLSLFGRGQYLTIGESLPQTVTQRSLSLASERLSALRSAGSNNLRQGWWRLIIAAKENRGVLRQKRGLIFVEFRKANEC